MGILSITLGVLRRFTGGIDPILKNWFAGMNTPPSKDVQKIFNTYFIDYRETIDETEYRLKDIIAKADVLYFPVINNTNDSWRNMVKNAHHGTISGTGLVFDPYWGFSNPDGTGYIDTNYNPSTQGFQYKQNNAGIIIYHDTNEASSTQWSSGIYATNYIGFRLNTDSFAVNQSTVLNISSIPFRAGLHGGFRTNSSAINSKNQNLLNTTGSNTSTTIPNGNIYIYNCNGLAAFYLGGVSFYCIGASLSDSEYQCLNNAVNQTLIQLLFYKYGSDNWGVKMAKSYFYDLHGFEKYEAWEVYEFIKRMQSDYVDGETIGYYYNTFGPLGQNKTIADFIMLFKAGGNLIANAWSKTGAALRWNHDGSIANSNTMPAYTRGSNLGIVTVSSTDGWDMLSNINNVQTYNSVNSFYGNFPRIGKIKTNNKLGITSYYNRIKFDLRSDNISNWCNSIYIVNILFPGGIKFNLHEIIGKYFNNLYLTSRSSLYDSIIGDVTELTDEVHSQFSLEGNGIYGNFSNMKLPDSLTQFFVLNSSNITSGLPIYNRNISNLYFSGCKLDTSAVDAQLKVINTYFENNTPIKNVTINLGGATMGIPTGGANNTDLLGIIAKHVAAGFTATITVRTS